MAAEGRQQQLLAGCKFETTVALSPSWVFFLAAFIKKELCAVLPPLHLFVL